MTTVSSDQKFQDAFIRLLEYFLKKKKNDSQFKTVFDAHLPDFIVT
jgi:hypothetical protein